MPRGLNPLTSNTVQFSWRSDASDRLISPVHVVRASTLARRWFHFPPAAYLPPCAHVSILSYRGPRGLAAEYRGGGPVAAEVNGTGGTEGFQEIVALVLLVKEVEGCSGQPVHPRLSSSSRQQKAAANWTVPKGLISSRQAKGLPRMNPLPPIPGGGGGSSEGQTQEGSTILHKMGT